MTDTEALAMPLDRHRMFIAYQNEHIKQMERARR